MKTSRTEAFFGREYLSLVETLNDNKIAQKKAQFMEVDNRNSRKRKITLRDVAVLYGQRPKHQDVWHLSPYEFLMYWKPELARYPTSVKDLERGGRHVTMTPCGLQKLIDEDANLIPGVDYVIKNGGVDWLAYPDCGSTKSFRHTWILIRRRRPVTPTFFGAPVPRYSFGEQQRAALIVMSYFHPWTLRKINADEHVKHASNLRQSHQIWQEALECWLDGNVLCQEAKRYIGNFMSVNRMRPRDDDSDAGNSEDIVDDEELEISRSSLTEALVTKIGGKDSEKNDDDNDNKGDEKKGPLIIKILQLPLRSIIISGRLS